MGIWGRACYTENIHLGRKEAKRDCGAIGGKMRMSMELRVGRKMRMGRKIRIGMDGKIGFAVIGCGMISKFHISAISRIEEAYLAGVYDASRERAEGTAAEHGVRAYGSLEEIWEDKAVDAVCICTPSGLHGAAACEALAHDCHVLVEKPMALTLEDCDKMLRLAGERHVKLSVVSQLRFSPAVQQARRLLESGALGRLLNADLHMKYFRSQEYYDSGGWRGTWAMDGGGALMNQGIHGVDLLLYLAGPAASVYGRAATLARRIEVEDTLSAVALFESGALGVIQADTAVYPGFPRRIELCGDKGSVILEEDKIVCAVFEGELPEGISVRETEGDAGGEGAGVGDTAGEGAAGEGIIVGDAGGEGVSEGDTAVEGVSGGCAAADSEADSEQRNEVSGGHRNPSDIGSDGHFRQVRNLVNAILRDEPLLVDGYEGRKAVELILGIYRSVREGRPVSLD